VIIIQINIFVIEFIEVRVSWTIFNCYKRENCLQFVYIFAVTFATTFFIFTIYDISNRFFI